MASYWSQFRGSSTLNTAQSNSTGVRLNWSFTAGSNLSSPAIGNDGVIYFGTLGYLVALNASGGLLWKHSLGSSNFVMRAPVVASNGNIYAATYYNNIYGFNPNGQLIFTFLDSVGFSGSPAIGSDGKIYAVNDVGILLAINPSTASTLWSFTGCSMAPRVTSGAID